MGLCIPKMCLEISLSAATIREFLDPWVYVMNFWFATARTLYHHVCVLASSSNIQLRLCTHDCPAWEENLCYSTMLVGMSWSYNSIFNGDFSCPPVISIDLFFPPTPFVLKHVEALRYSWYWYPYRGYFKLPIISLFLMVLLTTFWK
jgi:hypothetical protein